jgi:hypothetical protein
MAKSRAGGSRSYLRGKLGSDVYSIGKDGKGKKQQVVRALAETVKNPQTIAQMRGRMIMSTVMQAQSAMAYIVDHSFDGVPAGQPSISEFIRRNYELIKADVAANPSTGNAFGLVKYQEKGVRGGVYVVSNGNAQLPSNVEFDFENLEPAIIFNGLASGFTAGNFRSLLGLAVGDYFTLVYISSAPGRLVAHRLKITDALPDATVITDANASQLFEVESINDTDQVGVDFDVANDGLSLKVSSVTPSALGAGLILSKKVNGQWTHNKCVLNIGNQQMRYTADVALPTYPVGSERFLNGGDL